MFKLNQTFFFAEFFLTKAIISASLLKRGHADHHSDRPALSPILTLYAVGVFHRNDLELNNCRIITVVEIFP